MPQVEFTPQLAQHVQCAGASVEARTLRQALAAIFELNPQARGYVLDDQGSVRKHVAVFVDSQLVHDRQNLDIQLNEDSTIYIMQALSGG